MKLHPEVQEYEEAVRKGRRALLDGFVNFLVSSLLYTIFAWYLLRVLERNDVVSFKFTWIEIAGLVYATQFVRIWDRAVMRGQKSSTTVEEMT